MFKSRGELGNFEDNKIRFLNETHHNSLEGTKGTNYNLFKTIVVFENKYKKDFIDFSNDEIDSVLQSVARNTLSKQRCHDVVSMLKNYEKWAKEVGLHPTNVLYMTSISVTDDLVKFIDKKKLSKKFITKKELFDIKQIIEKNSDIEITPQDFLSIILPFYGIYGRECSEISNLKMKDVDKSENKITVRDIDGKERVVKVDEKLIDLIVEAYEQTEYKRRKDWVQTFIKTDYVLKSSKTSDEKLSVNGVRLRFTKVLNHYNEIKKGEGRSLLTMKSVITSAKYAKLKELEVKKGNLLDEDFRQMQIEFGDNPKSYFKFKDDYKYYMPEYIDEPCAKERTWLVLFNDNNLNENHFTLDFKNSIHNLKYINNGDKVVYYILRDKTVKGIYEVCDKSLEDTKLNLKPILELKIGLKKENRDLLKIIYAWGDKDDEVFVNSSIAEIVHYTNLEAEIYETFIESSDSDYRSFLDDNRYLENEKIEIIIEQIKRYKKIVNELKKRYNNICQVEGCDFTFMKKDGDGYSEAHHLIPLSQEGGQQKDNVVILCANHHRMFHYADVEIYKLIDNKRKVTINGRENHLLYKNKLN